MLNQLNTSNRWLYRTILLAMGAWLTLVPTVSYADSSAIKEAAKTAGNQIYDLVMIIGFIIGLVVMAIGWSMKATGSQRLSQEGITWVFRAGIGICGLLTSVMVVKFIYDMMTKGGGSTGFQLPFS